MLNKTSILGVGVTNETTDEILKYLLLSLEKSSTKYFIVTPNPEILVHADRHPHYKKILNEAKIALPDGVGVFLAALLTGKPLQARITGVDFMGEVCKACVKWPISVGFLGGRKGVAERVAECLVRKYPYLKVVFAAEEWREEGLDLNQRSKIKDQRSKLQLKTQNLSEKKEKILNTKYMIRNTNIDFLFVAFGHPRQEEWIYENLENLPVKVAMGVGGAFDYISGEVDRAPFMVRAMGFEWLYRLIREPWRWRRQLALPKFVWLVMREGVDRIRRSQKL